MYVEFAATFAAFAAVFIALATAVFTDFDELELDAGETDPSLFCKL